MPDERTIDYGQRPARADIRPRLKPGHLLLGLVVGALAIMAAAAVLPGVRVDDFWGALLAALLIAVVNAVVPPLIAALRLPYTVGLAFLLVLVADALALQAVGSIEGGLEVDDFGWALLAALVISAVSTVLQVIIGTNDDDAYSLSVVHRVARRSHDREVTDVPGILFLEIDGLAKPVLQRAMRDGNAPVLASWLAANTHRLVEWETDLSSQTGASQAGILLGSNENIPAFRWVEKERMELMVCSNPDDCAELERRHAGDGLLRDGGASRGNLLSGEADHALLTASRVSEEKKANPGYRAFFANGFNVTRTLVLVIYEVLLEVVASARQRRRDVRPRGHRGGIYPLLRAGMCVAVRDLTVYAVLSDMFVGRPAIYATFASYDEVAHHSGLERPDTLEALRKLDQQFGRLERARRYAPRPYEIVVLSDHGQTQGATFKQRNGYALEDLVRQSVEADDVRAESGEDESRTNVGVAFDEATGKGEESGKKRGSKKDVSGEDVVVLGSGNLGLVYLLDEPRRMTREEIDARHPRLIQAAHRARARRLRRRPLGGRRPGRARSARNALPLGRARRGRGSARGLLAERRPPPAPLRRVHERARPLRQQLLRPRAGRGLRLRGAHLVPRRDGRPPDPAVHPRPRRAAVARRAARRRGLRARAAQRLAAHAPDAALGGVAGAPAARSASARRKIRSVDAVQSTSRGGSRRPPARACTPRLPRSPRSPRLGGRHGHPHPYGSTACAAR